MIEENSPRGYLILGVLSFSKEKRNTGLTIKLDPILETSSFSL
jgi:hypothetical protein